MCQCRSTHLSKTFDSESSSSTTANDDDSILVTLYGSLGRLSLATVLLDLLGIGSNVDVRTFDFELELQEVLRCRCIFDVTGLAVEAGAVLSYHGN